VIVSAQIDYLAAVCDCFKTLAGIRNLFVVKQNPLGESSQNFYKNLTEVFVDQTVFETELTALFDQGLA
jgi:hypothetical protein